MIYPLRICRLFLPPMMLCIGILFADDLEERLKFYVPFDRSTDAVLAEGNEKGSPAGNVQFAEGIDSQALVCGKHGSAVIFDRQDNLDFDSPGTVTCWFKIDCPHGTAGPAIPFWGIGNDVDKGLLALTVLNDPLNLCPCRREIGFMFHSKQRKSKAYGVTTGERRICSGWHLISGAWAGKKLYVSLDGEPYRSYELDKPLSNAEFEYCKRFGVGVHYTNWHYLLDDFRIFDKCLSDDEIKSLYDAGLKKLQTEQ